VEPALAMLKNADPMSSAIGGGGGIVDGSGMAVDVPIGPALIAKFDDMVCLVWTKIFKNVDFEVEGPFAEKSRISVIVIVTILREFWGPLKVFM
jgi:hypothetical protein